MISHLLLPIVLLVFSTNLAARPILAERPEAYYGNADFIDLTDAELRDELFYIISNAHISHSDGYDTIANECSQQNNNCYRHTSLGYRKARRNMFGSLHLQGDKSSQYQIRSFYCQSTLTNSDFPSGDGLGKMKIPSSNVINAEHSWPQSLFTPLFPKGMQKSDLHALFPVKTRVNTQRSNLPFGRVDTPTGSVCSEAEVGEDSTQDFRRVFSPSDDVKGDIARAIFYFSVRYKMNIDDKQEHYLRLWHWRDPVDASEQRLHEGVYALQYNRNPFIDYPELIEQIEDF